MSASTSTIDIEYDAPVSTWFGLGGTADRLARPANEEELALCLEMDPDLRVLGDGANLLVRDGGVEELVVRLDRGPFREWSIDEGTGLVIAGGGARLPQLINACVRAGLGGLEGLAGIPASVGGAVVMNAGGAYGEIAERVERVHTLDRAGRAHAHPRSQIDFGYRRSLLNHLIVTRVELRLEPGDRDGLREILKDRMAAKKSSQPLGEDSAGCVFKNPTLREDLDGVGAEGDRVSAGLLLDRAGMKGEAIGGAEVSGVHANFIITRESAASRDVLGLMERGRERVAQMFGVELEPEVVVWGRET